MYAETEAPVVHTLKPLQGGVGRSYLGEAIVFNAPTESDREAFH